jgi:hypothetical protein
MPSHEREMETERERERDGEGINLCCAVSMASPVSFLILLPPPPR